MIGYFCDVCNNKIERPARKYLIRVSEDNQKQVKPIKICLCESCKESWELMIPRLFDFQQGV